MNFYVLFVVVQDEDEKFVEANDVPSTSILDNGKKIVVDGEALHASSEPTGFMVSKRCALDNIRRSY